MPFQPKQHNIDLDVLQSHFHLPMAQVAKKFNVCLTFFKKICRQHGIKRWPYRKLRSLEKKITTLSGRVEGRVESRAEANLTTLNDQLTRLKGLKRCENYFADTHRTSDEDQADDGEAYVEAQGSAQDTTETRRSKRRCRARQAEESEVEFDPSAALAGLAQLAAVSYEESEHRRGSEDSGATLDVDDDRHSDDDEDDDDVEHCSDDDASETERDEVAASTHNPARRMSIESLLLQTNVKYETDV